MTEAKRQAAVMVSADNDETMPPESEEQALALNAEELKFWVEQVGQVSI